MAIWIAIILGIIQGVTEFLPVSSSGHLLLAEKLLSTNQSLYFNLLLHLATLIAVVLFFWKDVVDVIKKPWSKKGLLLLLSTFCTATIAFAISFIPGAFEGIALGPCFLISALVLTVGEIVSRKYKKRTELSASKAFAVGLVQGVAALPGLSRSGLTISSLRAMGIDGDESTSYSFLLSIPVIVGGVVLELAKGSGKAVSVGFWPCAVAFVFAFVFGYLSLFFLKKLIKNQKWWVFVPYLIVIGILVTVWQYA